MKKIKKFIKSPVKSSNDILMKRLPLSERNKGFLTDKLSKFASDPNSLPTIYIIGFSTWKKFIRKYFKEYNLVFIEKSISKEQFNRQYRWQIMVNIDKSQIFIWGYKAPDFIFDFVQQNDIKTYFVEDGFIRSVGLGATKEPPLSLCLDSIGPYFDSTKPTDLETLLNSYECDSALLSRAKGLIDTIKSEGISKYNHSKKVEVQNIYGEKRGKRVLVIGQVEDDASIKYGCTSRLTNNDLVRLAAAENPDAQIIYKVHPDVLNGHRDYLSSPLLVRNICQVIEVDIPLTNALETIDHVYTMTSLSGFEALLRDIKVTTIGAPFYSGWGLTDDRQPTDRRQRKLSLEALFAISYIVYPSYFDAYTGASIEIEDTIAEIIRLKKVKNVESYSVPLQRTSVIPQGIYRHYKGSLYQVLHTAQHSETEESLVVYRCLYGEYGVWVRPLDMFAETVTVDGKEIPRFELIKLLND